ncbi:MAG: NTP transferase domain-containing protein [Vicingaceae bacterium]|nr:NTP transferase domain-containing protein [Vicingaceae bacterium]
MQQKKVSLILLSGGKSTRMGMPKAWVKLYNKSSFAEQILSCYNTFGLQKQVLVLNKTHQNKAEEAKLKHFFSPLHIIYNSQTEKGRLYSIKIGLEHINTDLCFIHNIDQPIVKKGTLEALLNQSSYGDVIIPTYHEKGGHPILIGKNIINELKAQYKNYASLKELLNQFKKTYVAVYSNEILTNINTPNELIQHLNTANVY